METGKTGASNLNMSKKRMVETILSLQQATQIGQMFLKQIADNLKNQSNDIDVMHHILMDLQYRILGIADLAGVDSAKLDAYVVEKKTVDFNEESTKKDIEEGLVNFESIDKECTVVITSTTENEKENIFRARLKMYGPGMETFLALWLGKKAGETVETEIAGKKHQVTFLSVMKGKPQDQAVN